MMLRICPRTRRLVQPIIIITLATFGPVEGDTGPQGTTAGAAPS